jgi:endo-1,4-beta-D-glucanase Y
MPKQQWTDIFTHWFNWYNSGAGPYFNHGDVTRPYYIKNYNYAANPAYAVDPSKMVTLSEGQSYGMWYALCADNLPAFVACYQVMVEKHKLTRANQTNGKSLAGQAWSAELADFNTREAGLSLLEDKGATPSLQTFGWVWSEDYGSENGNLPGLASLYMAPDGDVVYAACLLMAYERWNVREFLKEALQVLTDLAQYGVRKCGTRYALNMGGYKGGGGFVLPPTQGMNLNGSTVYPGAPVAMIFNNADFATGDAIRLYNPGGATAPAGLSFQDGIGSVWPKYYLRVVDSYNNALYPTKADANANTNPITVTTTGSGDIYIIPYECQTGQIATDPSYLFAPFFRMFAKYDSTNAAIWNNLSTQSYSDISDSCSRNFWGMPAYLEGINKVDGTGSTYRSGGASNDHNLDAVRVAVNLAFDASPSAVSTLALTCNLSGGVYSPKAGAAGGIWRYWLDTGMIPSTMAAVADQVLTPGVIDTTADTVDLGVDYLTDNSTYSNPINVEGTALPGGLSASLMYYPHKVSGSVYSLHLTQAAAFAGTGKVDITSVGTAVKFVVGNAFGSAQVDTVNDVVSLQSGNYVTWKTGSPMVFSKESASTAPGGLTPGLTYYPRNLSLSTFSLHSSASDAIAGLNKVNITTAGSGGNFMLNSHDAPVGWYYRGSGFDPISPYGAAQILAMKYILNGYSDAETFYNALPAWVVQQPNGSFVENNGDYYPQHPLGLMASIMGGQAPDKYNGAGYLQFNSQTDAQSAINGIAAALGVSNYGNLLTDNSGNYLVPVVGPRAFDALTSDQKTAIIKLTNTSGWRTLG